jgi:hypothetical protein
MTDDYDLQVYVVRLHQEHHAGRPTARDPLPGVDYEFLAELPKLRAFLENDDQTLFQATPLVFGMLIDERPDSKNHASHLLITKAERSELLRSLDAAFGQKLDDKKPNYVVGSAALLKAFLSKNFKCADEPWE